MLLPVAILSMFATGFAVAWLDGQGLRWRITGLIATGCTLLIFAVWTVDVVQRAGGRQQRRTAVWVIAASVVSVTGALAWPSAALGICVAVYSFARARAVLVACGLLALTGASIGWWQTHREPNPSETADAALVAVSMAGTVALAVVVSALMMLVVTARRLEMTRQQLIRLRVNEERTRLLRTFHEVLGETLEGAAGQNAAALQALGDQQPDAHAHLKAVETVILEGQRGLLDLTTGPVSVDPGDEIVVARDLCEQLGIDWRATTSAAALGRLPSVAGTVIREAVTNMLKHSSPTFCRVAVDLDSSGDVLLTITNDGARLRRMGSGAGLSSLASAVREVGGSLETRHPRDLFQLMARFPSMVNQGMSPEAPR